MEPQEINYCCVNNKKERRTCKCFDIIIAILAALFLATLGLILGAVFTTALLANLGVLILATVLLALGIILIIIYKICACSKKKCCC